MCAGAVAEWDMDCYLGNYYYEERDIELMHYVFVLDISRSLRYVTVYWSMNQLKEDVISVIKSRYNSNDDVANKFFDALYDGYTLELTTKDVDIPDQANIHTCACHEPWSHNE